MKDRECGRQGYRGTGVRNPLTDERKLPKLNTAGGVLIEGREIQGTKGETSTPTRGL